MTKRKGQHTGMHPALEQPRYFPDLHASQNSLVWQREFFKWLDETVKHIQVDDKK